MAEVRIPTTAEEWEAKRAVITRLYSSDGLTLAQVQKTLKDVHGFQATVRMFKAGVEKWGLDKKNKVVEMEAIFRAKQECDAIDKKLVFYVRGEVVDFAEVRSYRRRKGVNPDTIMRPNVTSKNAFHDWNLLSPA